MTMATFSVGTRQRTDPERRDPVMSAVRAFVVRLVAEVGVNMGVELESEFPVDAGSLELFLMPPEPPVVSCSLRFVTGEITVWQADCSTMRHGGCHWSDRHPDEVWVTSTGILGLVEVSLVP